jgi:peptide/nickel transport system ATP-binding protein
VQPPGRIVEGKILYYQPNNDGRRPDGPIDLAALNPKGREIRAIRGKEIAMIFQEPMTSLSPVHTIGDQISENVLLHQPVSREQAKQRTIEVLGRVGIPRPADRFDAYPFQLSGGMRQRAMVAMALSCDPNLLIADEPTTALDVTTQAQIIDLMRELQDSYGMAIMFITHDLGVVAEVADDVAVMYLGIVAERGSVDDIFHDPKHPYTRALLRSIPRLGRTRKQRLDSIEGMVPDPYNRPTGCPFHPRCEHAMPGLCDRIVPPITALGSEREVRCHLYPPGGGPPRPVMGSTSTEKGQTRVDAD